ncbi:MBL fold metallo-hydrolase [Thiocapsa sp.]|uniref:MBL fold metallo-hydrolase n=1 Tax=Thiocapsa sp. TaxID=2024551 RepID=UPI003593A450
MRFCSLGSGSRGNATLVESAGCRVLVDNGFSLRELYRRLSAAGVEPDSIDVLLLTHEHGDHVKGVRSFARRHRVEVWTTPGTWRAVGAPAIPRLRLLCGQGQAVRIDGVHIRSYPVPHDAREPCQFLFEADGRRLGMLTDAGCVTSHMTEILRDCDALILELNHDPELLRRGPYPPSLQRRVAGDFGHLSNLQAAGLLDALPHRAIARLCVAHISETNNHPDLVRASIRGVSESLADRTLILEQEQPSPWCSA